jgi:hypothetical protein
VLLCVAVSLVFLIGLPHFVRLGLRWRFFSSLAKLIHVWRDCPRQVYDTWSSVYGIDIARQRALRLPAKCIAGRWGSIMSSENDICPLLAFICSVFAWAVGLVVNSQLHAC